MSRNGNTDSNGLLAGLKASSVTQCISQASESSVGGPSGKRLGGPVFNKRLWQICVQLISVENFCSSDLYEGPVFSRHLW